MPHVTSTDAHIWWEEEGTGDPVLLIQGLGYPGSMWYRVVPALAERFRTIRFDNRGTGATGVPPGPYTIEMMAKDAVAVLDAAGVERAHVIGVSMGGLIAQELALTRPERVRSLILGCTHAGGSDIAPFDREAMEMLLARATMSPEQAAEVAIPFVYASSTPRSRIDEDFAVRLRQPTSPEGYTQQVTGAMAYGGTMSRLRSLSVPTLIVQGTQDRLVNPANADILAGAIDHAKVVKLDGASHVFFTDRPERTASVFIDFLSSQPTAV